MFDIRKIQEHALFEAVKSKSNEEIASKIVYGADVKDQSDEVWVNTSMHCLETTFDAPTTKEIRMACQCGYGMDEKIALVKELLATSSSPEEFANNDKAKAAGLLYQNGAIHLRFDFCPCPMLANVKKLNSKTWCQCTTGYSKKLFETAFGCPVNVELLKSIKSGDDCCLMKIEPTGDVWQRK